MKAGQPGNALEVTAGRRAVLNQLDLGVADKSAQAHAANWLRDLAKHYGLPNTYLTMDTCYRDLMSGNCTDFGSQKAALDWIQMLLEAPPNFNEGMMSMIDEAREFFTGPDVPDANARQPGGDHYKKRRIQHWDFVVSNGYRYLTGQITKYVFRWQDKGGALDLEKALHFMQKLEETVNEDGVTIDLVSYLRENNIHGDEALVLTMIHAYHECDNTAYLEIARQALERLHNYATTTPPPEARSET
jgi:hypothetical protein